MKTNRATRALAGKSTAARLAIAILGICLAGCGRAPEPPGGVGARSAVQKAAPPLPPEMQKIQDKLDKLADRTRMEIAQSERDRAELVTPAPPGFKPKVQGRKLELKLIPQRTMIRKGERFWYRAEIRNVGSESVTVRDPFIKSGDTGDPVRFKFRLVFSPSRPIEGLSLGYGMECDPGLKIPGWGKMDDRQREEAINREQLAREIDGHVSILVKPGETLRTRDWRVVDDEESCNSKVPDRVLERPGGLYREHLTTRELEKPGTYSIKLVLSDPPRPLSAESRANLERRGFTSAEIARHARNLDEISLGVAESDSVRLEVIP